jgi:hypothetical protein
MVKEWEVDYSVVKRLARSQVISVQMVSRVSLLPRWRDHFLSTQQYLPMILPAGKEASTSSPNEYAIETVIASG